MSIGKTFASWCQKQEIPCEFFSEISSTNDQAKKAGLQEDFKVFVADQQSHGRGRGENTWTSTKSGTSLLCSWVYKMKKPPQHFTAPLVGLSIYKSLRSTWPQLEFSIKAPNDLLLSGKKVGGLLIESLQKSQDVTLIIGIGLNILEHPAEFDFATNLSSALADKNQLSSQKLNEFFNEVHNNFLNSLDFFCHSQIAEEHCQQLLEALNSNPGLTEKYTHVHNNGDLENKSGIKSWQDI